MYWASLFVDYEEQGLAVAKVLFGAVIKQGFQISFLSTVYISLAHLPQVAK